MIASTLSWSQAENIVLDHEGHVRITDFGLAKDNVKGDTITSICGTPEYLAPEVIRRRPYGPAVDWWSLGTLLFEMLAGYPPFYDKVRQVMYRKILSAEFHAPDDMSRDAADLCERFLAREPTERLGYRGASEVKAHKFFRNIDWDALARKELSPPWVPPVLSAHDVSQIAPQWTDRAPKITESPEGLTLRDTMAVQETPPSFRGFTFAHEEVFGAAYR
jgi:serum/glucocorticoid-regulated kinase 2